MFLSLVQAKDSYDEIKIKMITQGSISIRKFWRIKSDFCNRIHAIIFVQ